MNKFTNSIFDTVYFTKQCSNCSYAQKGWFGNMEYAKCSLGGFYCSTERGTPTKCGHNYEKWKPDKSAFKENKKMKKLYPEYFI